MTNSFNIVLVIAVSQLAISKLAGSNVINPANRPYEVEVSTKRIKIATEGESRGGTKREHIKATDIMVGTFHGSHYRVTSAWPNVICLTPPR